MILIEKEAKEKYCPVTLSIPTQFSAAEQGFTGGPGKCEASKCMAWRFVRIKRLDGTEHESLNGYCGLAGKL